MSLADKFKDRPLPIPATTWQREPELLLHDNIPMPLHGMAPRVVLGGAWWNKERQAAYASTDLHCLACGTHKDFAKGRKVIEGHEVYKVCYVKGTMTYLRCVPLCNFCHQFVHDQRLKALVEQGKMHMGRFVAVIQHGDQVLADAGLPPRALVANAGAAGCKVQWKDWRLVIGTRKFAPLYESLEEYQRALR